MEIEIWPQGDIQIGVDRIGSDDIVVIRFPDPRGDAAIVGLHLRNFVSFADHCRMVADTILDKLREG